MLGANGYAILNSKVTITSFHESRNLDRTLTELNAAHNMTRIRHSEGAAKTCFE